MKTSKPKPKAGKPTIKSVEDKPKRCRDVMKENMAFIITMVTIISLAFSTYFYLEHRYALAADMRQMQQRLDYKITSDQLRDVQQRIWILEDRFRGQTMDQTTLEEYRKLQEQKAELIKVLDALIKKQ